MARAYLEQLPYLNEYDDVANEDDDARDVMAEECERNDKLRVFSRYEVTVVISGTKNAVTDDGIHGNGERQQPITLNKVHANDAISLSSSLT